MFIGSTSMSIGTSFWKKKLGSIRNKDAVAAKGSHPDAIEEWNEASVIFQRFLENPRSVLEGGGSEIDITQVGGRIFESLMYILFSEEGFDYEIVPFYTEIIRGVFDANIVGIPISYVLNPRYLDECEVAGNELVVYRGYEANERKVEIFEINGVNVCKRIIEEYLNICLEVERDKDIFKRKDGYLVFLALNVVLGRHIFSIMDSSEDRYEAEFPSEIHKSLLRKIRNEIIEDLIELGSRKRSEI